METTTALDAALNQERVLFFLATKMELPTGVVRLLDGSGEVTWGEGTFTADDATFGTIDAMEAISDGLDEQAPALSITFNPPSTASVANLASPSHQGSRCRIWLGAIETTTKTVIADPYQLFDGVLDQPTLNIDVGTRSVEMLCASSFEKLFADDEGNRLNPANHKDIWPGETGLDAITGIVRQIIWGPGDKISGSIPGGRVGGGGGGIGDFGVGGGMDPFDNRCVHAYSYVLTKRGEIYAYEVVQGDWIWGLKFDGSGGEWLEVLSNGRSVASGYRWASQSGIVHEFSDTTPLEVGTGECLLPPQYAGEPQAVQDEGGFRWEGGSIEEVGPIPVAEISVGGRTYAAGMKRGRYHFTHNVYKRW